MTEKSLIPAERIEKAILLIRGHKVMLDSDLASLYGVQVKVLNQAVKRNLSRFPEDFMFVLTAEEARIFKVTNCDLKDRPGPGRKFSLTPSPSRAWPCSPGC